MRSNDNLAVERFRPEQCAEWDAFIRSSRMPLFLFERAYMDYHADRFDDHSLVIREAGRIVALLPANLKQDTLFSHGGLTYGGLVTGTGIHAADVLAVFEGIAEYCRSAGIRKMLYKMVPSVFKVYPAEEDAYALTRVGATLVRRDLSSAIALPKKPKLSDSRKSTARKAGKAGAEFVELDVFAEFHALLAEVLQKFDADPVHSLDEIELLKSRFPTQIRVFGAVLDGKLLAGALVYDLGHIVHTQYLASSTNGRQLGALDFILIKLTDEVFSNKQFFSFGISTEQSGMVLNEGLIRQKEGFGGRGVVHDFYEWIF